MIEKKYGIIGNPLSHSLSPKLHNFWFKKNNIKANYSLIEIEKKKIKDIINKIRAREFHGINVTTPYKQEVKKKKVTKLFLSNRTQQKAEAIKKLFPFIEIISWENIYQKTVEMDIIINATSLGMKNNFDFETLIKKFKSSLVYYDVIYNPLETKMLKNFKEHKIKTFNGLEMFLFQAQKSFSLWNKIIPNVDDELKKEIVSNLKK